MNKKIGRWVVFLTFQAAMLSLTFACQLISIGGEEEISRKEASYLINPHTILESLAMDRTDIFVLQTEHPETKSSTSEKFIQWSQTDYYRIADALHKFAFNEPLDDWKLDGMSFGMDCKDIDYGPQYASFRFYNVVQFRDKESRVVHDINIVPQESIVWWTEVEYYPKLANWGSLNLTQVKISVNDALQIAEKNGGNQARLAVNNQCKFVASIPIWGYEGWNITYTGETRLFDINIDPLTGEYQIISTEAK